MACIKALDEEYVVRILYSEIQHYKGCTIMAVSKGKACFPQKSKILYPGQMTVTSFMRKMPLLFCKLQAKLEFTKLRNDTLSKRKMKGKTSNTLF